jgi:hypothetical protein
MAGTSPAMTRGVSDFLSTTACGNGSWLSPGRHRISLQSRLYLPAACFARVLHLAFRPRKLRAQGRPGTRMHPWAFAQKNCAKARSHRYRRIHSGLPCAVVYGLYALLCLQNLPECANGRFSQNRPSLDLSPKCSKAARACRGAWDRSGVFLNPNSCMGYEPERARKGMDDGTKRSGCRRT